MSKLAFKDSIFASFNSYWAANAPSPTPVIFFEDDPREKPVPGAAVNHNNIINYSWIRNVLLFNFVNDQSLGEVGNRRIEHEVTMVTSVFTPFGFGSELNDQLADICYSGMLAISVPNVCVQFPEHNSVGRDDNWLQSNVASTMQLVEVR